MKVLGHPLETHTSLESPEPSSPLAREQGIPATRLQGLKSSVISCSLPGTQGSTCLSELFAIKPAHLSSVSTP